MEPCSRVVADLIDEDPVACAEQLRCQLDERLVIDDIVTLVIDMNLAHDYAETGGDYLRRIAAHQRHEGQDAPPQGSLGHQRQQQVGRLAEHVVAVPAL